MSIATSVQRRATLRTAAAISLLPFLDRLPKSVAADPGLLRLGPPAPFSFDGLIERARQLAAQLYVPPPSPAPEVVQQIDYDAHHTLARSTSRRRARAEAMKRLEAWYYWRLATPQSGYLCSAV